MNLKRNIMDTVLLLYAGPKEEEPGGRRPCQIPIQFIEISVAYPGGQITIPTPGVRQIRTSSSPRDITNELEKRIQTVGYKPSRRDMLFDSTQDKQGLYKFSPRHIDYFSCVPDPKKTTLTIDEQRRLLEMHEKIYPIFENFIKENSPQNGNGYSNGNGKGGHNGHATNGTNGLKK